MKRQLLLLAITLMPLLALADAVEIDGIYYNLIEKGKVAEVTSNPNYYTGDVTIPEKVTYNEVEYSVTSIGYAAFRDCSRLTSITLPNSLLKIDFESFRNCIGLSSIEIPNSVSIIAQGAFRNCI